MERKRKQLKYCSLQVTQQQIEDYHKEIEGFFHKFMSEGPGSVGEDLDRGKYV